MTTNKEALTLALDRLERFIDAYERFVDAYPHDITVSKEEFLRPFKEALAQPKTVNQFHPDYADEAINEMTLTIQKQAQRIEELEQEASSWMRAEFQQRIEELEQEAGGQYMTGYEVARSEFQQRIQELEAQAAQPEQSGLNPLWLATHPDKLAQPEQEPVAIQYASRAERDLYEMEDEDDTTPPQRNPLMEWQPIGTAPKDGTRILFVASEPLPPTCKQAMPSICWWDAKKNGWMSDLCETFGGTEDPIFWMHLPAIQNTTPPQRKPLDIKEIKFIATYCGEHITDEDVIEITRRVEEAHGIKE